MTVVVSVPMMAVCLRLGGTIPPLSYLQVILAAIIGYGSYRKFKKSE